jgi:hypothetical protein
VRSDEGDQQMYLWETMKNQPVRGRYEVDLTDSRIGKRVVMEVRSARITLELPCQRSNRQRVPVEIGVVFTREEGDFDDPLEWMLLTTNTVETFEDACCVLFGYTQRWRIEEFHKAWKTGACRVEDSQLRQADHLTRWAVILASVAVRLLRMTYLARTLPDAPASTEFTQTEITAVKVLVGAGVLGSSTTIRQMVLWIAQLGGHVRTPSTAPGFLVLARGLSRIQSAVDLLTAMEKT